MEVSSLMYFHSSNDSVQLIDPPYVLEGIAVFCRLTNNKPFETLKTAFPDMLSSVAK
jgi:hypothetical protein